MMIIMTIMVTNEEVAMTMILFVMIVVMEMMVLITLTT